jgi:hypothetical protein
MRGLDLPFERFSFVLQHILLIVLPLIWVVQRRYDLYKVRYALHCSRYCTSSMSHRSPSLVCLFGSQGFRPTLMCWAAFFLMHLDLFWPVSLFTLSNVNYMMVPPNAGALRVLGDWYRPAMAVFCILLGWISREVIVGLTVKYSGIVEDAAAETAALTALGYGGDMDPRSPPSKKKQPAPSPVAALSEQKPAEAVSSSSSSAKKLAPLLLDSPTAAASAAASPDAASAALGRSPAAGSTAKKSPRAVTPAPPSSSRTPSAVTTQPLNFAASAKSRAASVSPSPVNKPSLASPAGKSLTGITAKLLQYSPAAASSSVSATSATPAAPKTPGSRLTAATAASAAKSLVKAANVVSAAKAFAGLLKSPAASSSSASSSESVSPRTGGRGRTTDAFVLASGKAKSRNASVKAAATPSRAAAGASGGLFSPVGTAGRGGNGRRQSITSHVSPAPRWK